MAARSERTLRELVRIIAGRFLGMVVVFLLVVAAAGVATWHAPKWYQSEVQLLAKPSQIANPLETPGIMRDQVILYISTLRALISSDRVLGAVLLRLDETATLSAEAAAKLKWPEGEAVKKFIAANTERIDELRERLTVVTPGGPDATFTQTLRVQVIWPEERELAVKLGKDSRKLAAERALQIAQNVVAAYELRYAELELKRATDATKFLSDKSLAAARIDLAGAEAATEAFIRDKAGPDMVDIATMSGRGVGAAGKASLATTYAEKMSTIEEMIAGLESIKAALQTQLALQDGNAIAVPDSIMAVNTSVKALEAKILELKLHINSLTPRYTEDYKEVRTARSELADAMKEFRNELKKQLTRTQQELDALTAKRDNINIRFKADSERLRTLAISTAEWKRLLAAQEASQSRYDTEMERVVSATTARELSSVAIMLTILGDPSQPDPDKPAKPIMLLNLILAVVGGFILSLIYAFSADHFDHSLKSIDEAERYLGVPVLTSVPKLGRRMIRAKRGV
ncbi:MAG: hypothetical protein H8E53_03690 [Planctomycetes bacterium]|nr:hypothetical protein [Planctomycetota bacterium]